MQTKLTLRMDESLIRRAKAYARRSGKSVSRVVADYFALLDESDEARDDAWDPALGPGVASLLGVMAGSELDEGDYRRHLEEKHR